MKILKFGGTSLGTPERMHAITKLIIQNPPPTIVVLSAVSGTTNTLVSIAMALREQDVAQAKQITADLHRQYQDYYQGLLQQESTRQKGKAIVEAHFEALQGMAQEPFNVDVEKEILAQGELLSTKLFSVYLEEQHIEAVLLPALDFMRIDALDEPDEAYIQEHLSALLQKHADAPIYVTQGYICLNSRNRIDNLQRGGSDYTASIIGAAVGAKEIQIWTDIDGMHNNDPRVVKNTFPVAELSFNEAAELAYFGAKILHPFTIRPAQRANIPCALA